MDVLGVLVQCSMAKDFGLVLAMLMSHSAGDPYVVKEADVNEVGFDDDDYAYEQDDTPEAPRTRQEALADIRRLKQPLIGLLPVPPAWAAIYQHTPEDLLDPCTNVSVATAQLSLYERKCAHRRDPRGCALHAYAQEADAMMFEFDVLDTLAWDNLPRSAPVAVETPEILGANPMVSGTPSRGDVRGMFVFTEPVPPPAAPAEAASDTQAHSEPKPSHPLQPTTQPSHEVNYADQSRVHPQARHHSRLPAHRLPRITR